VLLNNEMDDFSIPNEPNGYGLAPAEANFVAAGKKPLSSMSPMIVESLDGQVSVCLLSSDHSYPCPRAQFICAHLVGWSFLNGLSWWKKRLLLPAALCPLRP
jgi:Gamma-glutamyltranspeptidase